MSAPLISRIGEALWGAGWPQQMARVLDVDERTCRRWQTGEMMPTDGVYADLVGLLHEQEGKLMMLRNAAQRKASGMPE